MIHFEHNAVDNADAILKELGNINYLYSYYHSNKFFDLAHKDQNLYLKCVKDHVNGKFAYHFMKLTVHDNIDTLPTHTKALCKHIQSQQFIDTANQIFNKKVTESKKLNITKYANGCFLNLHSDDVQNRKIAFIYYFNRNWRPDWGGTLNFVLDDGIKCYNPEHGSLIMFDIENSLNKHYVTQVSPMIQQSRYAIGGWLQ
jgi:Rps23 Pro-64 3,4-dihydroxylase Tpa1-like proline 4-hydroxylase